MQSAKRLLDRRKIVGLRGIRSLRLTKRGRDTADKDRAQRV
jgi:hypothetical protein